jgi:hypothetical protein
VTARGLAITAACVIGLISPIGTWAQAPAGGTASIAGIVRTADAAAKPVARVIVTVTGSAVPAGRSAITDTAGRFAITGLPAGRYTLTAKKPAYLTAAYGASRPGRAGIEVALAEGQHVTELAIPLWHGAAVSGLVRDALGQPLPNAQISVLRRSPNGLTPVGSATSDDRGQYRVFGLAPGEYFVSALEYSLIQTVVGNITTAQVDAALGALKRGRASAEPLPATPTVNLASVFYGGAVSADQASPVRIAAGEDHGGVDITIVFARTAAVTGTVVMPAGVSTSAVTIMLVPADLAATTRLGALPSTRPTEDGTFRIPSVNPGHYILDARVGLAPAREGGPPSPKLWGEATIDVTGDDVTGVSVALRPLLHATGRVIFDGMAATPDLSKVQVHLGGGMLAAVTAARLGLGLAVIPVGPPIAADGSFDIEASAGQFTYIVGSLPPGVSVRSAVVEGHDVLDLPFSVGPDASVIPSAVITLTDRHTSLAGSVQASAAHAASDYVIVLFPADPALRRAARRVKTTRADTEGRYRFADLPGGDYLIAALADFLPEDLDDPTFLDSLVPSALKVLLAEGQDKTQDLRIGGSPDPSNASLSQTQGPDLSGRWVPSDPKLNDWFFSVGLSEIPGSGSLTIAQSPTTITLTWDLPETQRALRERLVGAPMRPATFAISARQDQVGTAHWQDNVLTILPSPTNANRTEQLALSISDMLLHFDRTYQILSTGRSSTVHEIYTQAAGTGKPTPQRSGATAMPAAMPTALEHP